MAAAPVLSVEARGKVTDGGRFLAGTAVAPSACTAVAPHAQQARGLHSWLLLSGQLCAASQKATASFKSQGSDSLAAPSNLTLTAIVAALCLCIFCLCPRCSYSCELLCVSHTSGTLASTFAAAGASPTVVATNLHKRVPQ